MATPTKFEANGFAAMVAVIGMICAIYAGYRYAQDPTTARLTSLCLWVVGAIPVAYLGRHVPKTAIGAPAR